jgi:hypothetical protein
MLLRRDNAVRDVIGGMSVIGAALVWHVQVHNLMRCVDAARTEGQDES